MHRDKLALLLPILVPAAFLGAILAVMLLPAAEGGAGSRPPDEVARNLMAADLAYRSGEDPGSR